MVGREDGKVDEAAGMKSRGEGRRESARKTREPVGHSAEAAEGRIAGGGGTRHPRTDH